MCALTRDIFSDTEAQFIQYFFHWSTIFFFICRTAVCDGSTCFYNDSIFLDAVDFYILSDILHTLGVISHVANRVCNPVCAWYSR